MQATPLERVRGITAALPDGTAVDIDLSADVDKVVRVQHIRARSVSAIDVGDDAVPSRDWLDLRGFVLTAAAAEPHAHLDKAMSWSELKPPLGDLNDAITTWRPGSIRLDLTPVP